MDTIKMIAYRAETAMANSLQEKMSHPGEVRSLLMGIYNSEVDILPDPNQGINPSFEQLQQFANAPVEWLWLSI